MSKLVSVFVILIVVAARISWIRDWWRDHQKKRAGGV